MKILFNCTTNIVGGGVKNSAIFIKYALKDKRFQYIFAVSPQVKDILDKWNVNTDQMYLFDISPARDKNQRNRLKKLSKDLKADMVFTMAGPAYIDFDILHVMGMSNPYVSHVDLQGLRIGNSPFAIMKNILLTSYQSYYARKADFFIFQTNAARNGFCKRLFIDKSRTEVIVNSIGNEFLDYFRNQPFKNMDINSKISIFCPAAAYKHKALHLIPSIANKMREKTQGKYEFEFILTIDKDLSYWLEIENITKKLNVKKYIKTIGLFNYTEAPKLYEKSDLVFVPSILETFSASYLEAFVAKKPLIVADKGFARDICKDGAIYIDPFDPSATAEIINDLIMNVKKQEDIVEKGNKVVKLYGDQKNRYENIVNYLELVSNKGDKAMRKTTEFLSDTNTKDKNVQKQNTDHQRDRFV